MLKMTPQKRSKKCKNGHDTHSQLEVYEIFFGSLAHQSRLLIINLLRDGAKNVSEICAETKLEQTLVSHNLKRLERCGMVFMEKKGKNRYYSVNSENKFDYVSMQVKDRLGWRQLRENLTKELGGAVSSS